MRVFISSVIGGFEEYRDAAARAIEALGLDVVRSESTGAVASTSQQACLGGVRDSEVVLLLLGERYGRLQASGLSATHEEYRDAKESRPVLAFVQSGVQFEPRQRELITEVQDWASGLGTADFDTPDSLRDAVTRGLHRYELTQSAGQVDEAEIRTRVLELLPSNRPLRASLVFVVAGGPAQAVLRPTALEDPSLADFIHQLALFGTNRVLSSADSTGRRIGDHELIIEQENAHVLLNEMGSMRITQPALRRARSRRPEDLLSVLIEEDIRDKIEASIRLASEYLDKIDPTARLTDVIPAVALIGASAAAWRTHEEHERNPTSMTFGAAGDVEQVFLSPAMRRRQALLRQSSALSDDFVALLRRRIRSD